VIERVPLTVKNAHTPAELAKLFRLLFKNETIPTRDSVTCEMLKSLVVIIRGHHGLDGGPFREWVNRMLERSMSDIQVVARRLEAFPIADRDEYDIADYRPLYFVLSTGDGVWLPCYNAEDRRYVNGWISGGLRHKDGSTGVWPAELGLWADCDADGNPSMPFVEW